MRIDIYHHIAPGSEVFARLDVLTRKLDLILQREARLMSALTDALDKAEASAAANDKADDSAEKLLVTLSTLIAELKTNTTDQATVDRINALADAVNVRAAKLGAAVVATPTA